MPGLFGDYRPGSAVFNRPLEWPSRLIVGWSGPVLPRLKMARGHSASWHATPPLRNLVPSLRLSHATRSPAVAGLSLSTRLTGSCQPVITGGAPTRQLVPHVWNAALFHVRVCGSWMPAAQQDQLFSARIAGPRAGLWRDVMHALIVCLMAIRLPSAERALCQSGAFSHDPRHAPH